MQPAVQKEIATVLTDILKLLRTPSSTNVSKIKKLSNHTVHTATLFLDKDAISVTVVIYALSKVMERNSDVASIDRIISCLVGARDALQEEQYPKFRSHIRRAFKLLSALDKNINLYVDDVLTHSQIKKGCKICDHGVSCTTSAHLLNITQWDLMQYLGKTVVDDTPVDSRNTKGKLVLLRRLFV